MCFEWRRFCFSINIYVNYLCANVCHVGFSLVQSTLKCHWLHRIESMIYFRWNTSIVINKRKCDVSIIIIYYKILQFSLINHIRLSVSKNDWMKWNFSICLIVYIHIGIRLWSICRNNYYFRPRFEFCLKMFDWFRVNQFDGNSAVKLINHKNKHYGAYNDPQNRCLFLIILIKMQAMDIWVNRSHSNKCYPT